MINKDGLEAGQSVDFTTLMQIKAKQRGKKNGTGSEEKAEFHTDNKPQPKNTSVPARKKKAQES